jgi:phosphate uptake regulator
MLIRRLVKAGQSSHTVSLPKNWIERNNLNKGDIVYLNETSEKELIITPEAKEELPIKTKEITILIDNKETSTIQREITSAYINNYSTITLIGDSLTTKIKKIRNMLHDFVALEVAEQTAKQIVAKDLLNLKEISIEKTVRRMDMIVRSMLQDGKAAIENPSLADSVVLRDYEVNRSYFLLMRLLKSALNQKQISDFFEIENNKILSYWYLTINLENFADFAKNFATIFKKTKKPEEIKKIYEKIEKTFTTTMKAYYTADKKLAETISLERPELMESAEKLDPEYSELLKNMITIVNNIAKQVIDD